MSWREERVLCGDEDPKTTVIRWADGIPFRASVGFTCILSMIGAALIVFSYLFFKNLRNRARLILVHLSIMDFGAALSNLIGNFIYFDRFYASYNATCTVYHTPQHHYIESLCEGQAFFAHFFTMGSVLWTISLAVYLYCLLMYYKTSLAQMSLYASYFLCYGFPLIICVWLLLTKKFGYTGEGWCTLLFVDLMTGRPNRFVAVLGYDLWIYFTMTFVPVLYLAVQLHLREKLKQSKLYLRDGEERFKEALTILDYRFFLIPIMFALLRMWTCMLFIFKIYFQLNGIPPPMSVVVGYLSGIGDSAQGFVNGILFVLFTNKVRRTVFATPARCWRHSFFSSSHDSEEGSRLLGNVRETPGRGSSDRQQEQDNIFRERGAVVGTSEIITPAPLTQSYQSLY